MRTHCAHTAKSCSFRALTPAPTSAFISISSWPASSAVMLKRKCSIYSRCVISRIAVNPLAHAKVVPREHLYGVEVMTSQSVGMAYTHALREQPAQHEEQRLQMHELDKTADRLTRARSVSLSSCASLRTLGAHGGAPSAAPPRRQHRTAR